MLQRSNIPQKIIRFCISSQLHGIYDRDTGGGHVRSLQDCRLSTATSTPAISAHCAEVWYRRAFPSAKVI